MKLVLASLSLFFLSTLFIAGCGHSKIMVEEAQLTKNDYVAFNVGFLKDKGKKFDIELGVTNVSKNDIIIMLNDMQCFRGKFQGTLKHTFFNTGERTIDIRKNQMKKFRMVCTIGGPAEGDFRITVGRIFDNPDSDGETKGKVLVENIEWKAPEQKK